MSEKDVSQVRALVLNADYRPLSTVPLSTYSWQDAIKAVQADRVNVVEHYDFEVRSPSVSMQVPAVISLKEYVATDRKAAFTRENVFLRDGYCCQYCGTRFSIAQLTLDHVHPQSKGGKTVWENILSACGPCNNRKGDRTAADVGMKPLSRPHAPTKHELILRGRRFLLAEQIQHASWNDYLG